MNIEICRAFDLFEIILLVVLLIILIPAFRFLSIESKREQKTIWQSIKCDILLYLIGAIIGSILMFSYHYIKSMFC